jgi:hypothetical protein
MKKIIVVAVLRMVTEQALAAGPELIHATIQRARHEWSSLLPMLVIGMLVGRSLQRRMWQ